MWTSSGFTRHRHRGGVRRPVGPPPAGRCVVLPAPLSTGIPDPIRMTAASVPSCAMANDDVLTALASQGGIARVDLLARLSGRSARTVRAVAKRSRCWLPYPSVVGLPGIEMVGSDAWARAAVLHARGTTGVLERDVAALTRRSALHHLDVARSAPTRVEVVIPRGRSLTQQPRLAILRSGHLRMAEITRVRGVEVVTGGGLLRDLAAVRSLEKLRADAILLQHAGHLDVAELRSVYERCTCFQGRGAVGRVLTDLEAAGRVDSPLEFEFRVRFERDGIALDRGQVEVPSPVRSGPPTSAASLASSHSLAGSGVKAEGRTLHLDLGIAAVRFGIEVDSMAHHSAPDDLRRDAERRNRIAEVADDWRILYVTYADLHAEHWPRVVQRVRMVITTQSLRYLGVPWPRVTDLR